jgi:hypothetical protein
MSAFSLCLQYGTFEFLENADSKIKKPPCHLLEVADKYRRKLFDTEIMN